MKLSVIIPCYNEAENIPFLYKTITSIINKDVEIILVNNGSSDNSKEIFANQQITDNITILYLEKNEGYGAGILAGLDIANGDVLSWTHADLQTDFADVLKAFDLYKKAPIKTIVKGKRKNRNFVDELFTFGMQIFVWLNLKVLLNDINAQPKLFSKEFYQQYIKSKAPKDFSLDLYLLYIAKKNSYTILDFPVYFNNRLHGEAKGGGSLKTKINLIKRTITFILKLKKISKK